MNQSIIIEGQNTLTNSGEVLVVEMKEPLKKVERIENIEFFVDGQDASNGLVIEFRYWNGNEGDKKYYSDWILFEETNQDFLLSGIPVQKGLDVFFQFRFTKTGTGNHTITIQSIGIEFEQTKDGKVLKPSFLQENKQTVCGKTIGIGCKGLNFSDGIRVNCDKELWNPYELGYQAFYLQEQLSNAVFDLFGHCVKYFKVNPDKNTSDVILKEYSLFNVQDVKQIKVVVPNNEFPDNALNFSPVEIDFEPDFEIHISKEQFELAFGQGAKPQERDFLYFPLTGRLYEVNSAYLFKNFMHKGVYYKVGLRKWTNRATVEKDEDVKEMIDEFIRDIDEVIQEEREEEIQKVTKPQQYTVISTKSSDFIREGIHEHLEIQTSDLNNYWTVVAKYRYLLNTIGFGETAVLYKTPVDLDNDLSFLCWFNVLKKSWDFNSKDCAYFLSGHDGTQGLEVLLRFDKQSKSGKSIEVKLGQDVFEFGLQKNIQTDKWYGLVVNLSKTFNLLSVYVWEMIYDEKTFRTNPSQKQTTDLRLVSKETKKIDFKPQKPQNTKFELKGCELAITNLRLFIKTVEEEKQPLVLNQYVVKDNHLAILIDNAVPYLRMEQTSGLIR